MKIKRKFSSLYGRENTVSKAVSITNIILYLLILIIFRSNIRLKDTFIFFNSDFATTSGVLAGFLFTGVGILYSTNNPLIDTLKTTGNMRTVFKIFFSSIFSFTFSLITYFIKPLFLSNVVYIETLTNFQTVALTLILLVGIYLFINGLVLFLYALYVLKKILLESYK